MSPPERHLILGEARRLTAAYQAGGLAAVQAFRDLTDLLLRHTVLAPHGGVRLLAGPRGTDDIALGGWGGPSDPLPLTNGYFLRIGMRLSTGPPPEEGLLKVTASSVQYQRDRGGERWVFRYDYRRHPPDLHPAAHVQVRGTLMEASLPGRMLLEHVHFPSGRVSLEAVIRLLVDQFGVPANTPAEIWRPLLAESEAAFLRVAHQPLSGPDQ